MTRCALPPELAVRLVGDPIDAVTGAFFDDVRDFIVASRFPIEWRRTYSSDRAHEDRGLGRGWTHSLDHQLRIDLDGLRYVSPLRQVREFPFLGAATPRAANRGYVLTRRGDRFELKRPDLPPLAFHLFESARARLVSIGEGDHLITASYGIDGALESFTDGAGNTVVILRDSARITGVRLRPRGGAPPLDLVRYAYDGDLLVEMTDAYRQRMLYEYDAAGRIVRRTDRRGYSFFFRYDAGGRCVHSAAEDGVFEVTLEYAPLERRTKVTRSDGGVWQYFYDDAKTITSIVDPTGVPHTYVPRPEDGQIELEVDRAGNEVHYVYDADGAPVTRVDASGRPLTGLHRHRIPITPIEYELGQLADKPFHLPARPPHDALLPPPVQQALSLSADPAGGATTEVRDPQGLLLREEREGRARRYGYDPNGNLRWEIDFDGAKTEYEYASLNHRVKTIDANRYITQFDYTREDELACAVDPRHVRTAFARDTRGHFTGVSRGGASKDVYARDAAGRLVEKRSASGKALYTIARGPQGEVLERKFASGGFERFAYDSAMRVVRADTAESSVELVYTTRGDRSADLRDGKGVRRRFTGGELEAVWVLGKFVTRYASTQTPQGREITITDPTGHRHRLRDLGNGVFVRAFASGVHETAQYHPDGRCLAKHVYRKDAPQSRWERRFEYTAEGYLVAAHDSTRGATRYEHDTGHRLIAEHRPDGSTRTYRHDEAGNLLQNGEGYALYHANNQLAVANDHHFEHDERHAIASETWRGGHRRFLRDERDQLIAVQLYREVITAQGTAYERTRTWTAKYDALNRRIEKCVEGEKTVFYWDGDRLAAEILPSGALRIYVYADALAMSPVLFVDYESADAEPERGNVYAVFTDHLGCPQRVDDADGQCVWSARIEPYGLAHIDVGLDFHQPLRWPGHYFDREIGLQYNGFRTYSPALGRYLEPDPIGRGGWLENVYQYTVNPLHRVDTHGLSACPIGKGKPGNNREDGKDDEEDVEPLEVDSYGNLKRREVVGDQLEHDHIPSFAAVLKAINDQRAEDGLPPLNEKQRATLRNNLTAIEVDHDVHAESRTYKGRNNEAQVDGDSKDLQGAAERDAAVERKNLRDAGYSNKETDDALRQVHERNRSIGLYDDTLPDSLYETDN